MRNVKCFRTIVGEMIVSEYSEIDGIIILEKPLLMYPRTENETTNIWFEPYPFGSADRCVEIKKENIFLSYIPSKEILAKYEELVGNEQY